MKRIIIYLSCCTILIPSLVLAAPEGCRADYKFSPLTGQSCSEVRDCSPGDLFSAVTGQRCGTTQATLEDQVKAQNIILQKILDENKADKEAVTQRNYLYDEYNSKINYLETQKSNRKNQFSKEQAYDIANYSVTEAYQLLNPLAKTTNANLDFLQAQEQQLYDTYRTKLYTLGETRTIILPNPINVTVNIPTNSGKSSGTGAASA